MARPMARLASARHIWPAWPDPDPARPVARLAWRGMARPTRGPYGQPGPTRGPRVWRALELRLRSGHGPPDPWPVARGPTHGPPDTHGPPGVAWPDPWPVARPMARPNCNGPPDPWPAWPGVASARHHWPDPWPNGPPGVARHGCGVDPDSMRASSHAWPDTRPQPRPRATRATIPDRNRGRGPVWPDRGPQPAGIGNSTADCHTESKRHAMRACQSRNGCMGSTLGFPPFLVLTNVKFTISFLRFDPNFRATFLRRPPVFRPSR